VLEFPDINPVLFTLGGVEFRWYGLAYAVGFLSAYLLIRHQAIRVGWQRMLDQIDKVVLTLIVGVLIGGRLGYVLFYNLPYFLEHPTHIFAPWWGGMSFHGGAIGLIVAGAIFCVRTEPSFLSFWRGADLVVVTVPIGLGLGRIGNFINGELYGRVTDVPWGMVFPAGGPLARHPSQLYQAILEGPVLFAILWTLRARPWQDPPDTRWPHGSLMAVALVGFGSFRWCVEFVREPDPQLGIVALGMTMGQLLSVAMMAGGIGLYRFVRSGAASG
jgi:phosphatidylglycerol---prolipoprotein diacylglyceryl transferase